MGKITLKVAVWLAVSLVNACGKRWLTEANAEKTRDWLEGMLIKASGWAKKSKKIDADDRAVKFWQIVMKSNQMGQAIVDSKVE